MRPGSFVSYAFLLAALSVCTSMTAAPLAASDPQAETIVATQLLPRAQEIARIAQREVAAGRTLDPAAALPVYLRDKVVGTRP